jgi:hypothetical protein
MAVMTVASKAIAIIYANVIATWRRNYRCLWRCYHGINRTMGSYRQGGRGVGLEIQRNLSQVVRVNGQNTMLIAVLNS